MKRENRFTNGSQKERIWKTRWFIQTVQESNQQLIFSKILKLVKTGKSQEAYKEFVKFIKVQINKEEHPFYYVLKENMNLFGSHRTLTLLFNLTLSLIDKKLPTRQLKPVRVTKTTVDQFSKEVKTKGRFGFDQDGKKREAIIDVSIKKDKIQHRLRDKETGRFLKHSDSFNKEVEELQKWIG